MTQDLHAKALKNYFDHHVTPPTDLGVDVSGSLSACILAWQKTGNTSKLVQLALLSMALAVYARTRSLPQAAAEAYTIYHELLKSTQEEISRPNMNVTSIDACLLTVFLMARCESAMHNTLLSNAEDKLEELKSWSHHGGTAALLTLWYLHFKDQECSVIVKQTRRGLMKSFLLRKMPVPWWLRAGKQFGESGLELEYDRILVQSVNVRWATYPDPSSSDRISRGDSRQDIKRLASDLHNLKNHLPGELSYHEYESTHADQLWIQTPRLGIYTTPAHANLWAHVLATELVIIFTELTVLQHSTHTREEMEICTTLLQDLASQLAAIIPQGMGLVTTNGGQITIHTEAQLEPSQASRVVWPLSVAAAIHGYDEGLRRGFKSQLRKLGEIIGDGVLQLVSAADWHQL